MPTCGHVKIQPDGMKIKAANSNKKWDPVSRRMIDICLPPPPPPPPAVITSVTLTPYNYIPAIPPFIAGQVRHFTVSWTMSKNADVTVILLYGFPPSSVFVFSTTSVSADTNSIDFYGMSAGFYYAVITPVEGVSVSSGALLIN